jgi:hypothetical protein
MSDESKARCCFCVNTDSYHDSCAVRISLRTPSVEMAHTIRHAANLIVCIQISPHQLVLSSKRISAFHVAFVRHRVRFYDLAEVLDTKTVTTCHLKNQGKSCYLKDQLQLTDEVKLIRVPALVSERKRLCDVPCQPKAAVFAEIIGCIDLGTRRYVDKHHCTICFVQLERNTYLYVTISVSARIVRTCLCKNCGAAPYPPVRCLAL